MALRPAPTGHLRRSWRSEAADTGVAAPLVRSRLATAAAASHSAAALRWVYLAISVYAVGSLGLVATHRVGLTSEHVILLVLVAAGMVPRLRAMVRDWLPFLFVVVMFEDLGALQPLLAGAVHAAGPARLEREILGADAAPWLQAHLGGLHGPTWWQVPPRLRR